MVIVNDIILLKPKSLAGNLAGRRGTGAKWTFLTQQIIAHLRLGGRLARGLVLMIRILRVDGASIAACAVNLRQMETLRLAGVSAGGSTAGGGVMHAGLILGPAWRADSWHHLLGHVRTHLAT